MNFVKLVSSKLSVEEISDLVSSPSCGAISLFVGTTRDNFQNKKVRDCFCLLAAKIVVVK